MDEWINKRIKEKYGSRDKENIRIYSSWIKYQK